jgi:hypothetical protein
MDKSLLIGEMYEIFVRLALELRGFFLLFILGLGCFWVFPTLFCVLFSASLQSFESFFNFDMLLQKA